MAYLRNCWYIAGHAEEATDKPFARTLLNEPVLIYRTSDGNVVAMDNRCPHRMAPLNQGKVIEDTIQCPYHGLRFDGTGACVSMPLGGVAPPRAKLKTYPIVDNHRLLWIWMGEADRADPTLIPNYSDRNDDSMGWFTGVLHCKANYQLMVDNLLDLTHAEFLHPFLSSDGWAGRNEQKVTQQGDQITIVNIAENDNILPIMAQLKPSLGTIGKTIQVERWDAPSLIRLQVDYYSGDDCILLPSAHMLTPETETSTHYFIRGGQPLDPANGELTQAMRDGVLSIFQNEDIPIIEAQQRLLGDRDLMEHDPAILKTDLGPIRARRHLAKLIRQEQQSPDVPAVAAE
ncbi:aromatic ring-hydroxylating dioxygenase subunit alpha [Pseudomonas sp. Z18(2022)]|uniref:aromatic ring-hydroxylating dioxygenase subunit alpha n=1 Tax=Pseudomonas sp. Z18(2022) TaxID=2983410 RepID=UPI002E81DDC7|nr:aromatic ring-hydroxylating dioxygenase subunit alpha [Pseudomonas sp. Z18(2022)]